MELEAENWRLCSTTLVRGVAVELEAENWRVSSTTLVRGVAVELEAENWRFCSTTVVRGVAVATLYFSTRSNLWSWKLRTGDFVVQL